MLKNTDWKLKPNIYSNDIDINFDRDLVNILQKRGINTKESMVKFLNPKLDYLNDESGFKDIDIAYKRIKKAIVKQEKICIYGDYDVDGITSTSILYLTLKKLGAKHLIYYIPLREDGYGLNKDAIKEISSKGIDLIITVDCGITSYDEVYFAKMLGMDMIITDHHSILDNKIPDALAVINPKREDNTYPFKELAGVGTIFMLLKYMLKQYGREKEIYDFLDIVAIGTIADLVPLLEDNRILVKFGLKRMVNSKVLGIRELVKKLNLIEDNEINSGDISFKVAPIFNAAGRLEDAKIVVKMLISNNEKEINLIINELLENNQNRKEIQDKIYEYVCEEVEQKNIDEEYIIISSSYNYHHGVIGIVASKILEKYNRPSIIIEEKKDENIGVGSCRSREGFDITKALSSVSNLLIKYGGHKGAAGFTIPLENLEEFKKKISLYAKKNLSKDSFKKIFVIDKIITVDKLSYEFTKSLDLLKPFGMGNPTPIFVSKSLMLDSYKQIGKDNKVHLSFDFKQHGFNVKRATWFNSIDYLSKMKNEFFYDVLFKLKTSKFQGKYYTSMLIEDMRVSNYDDETFKLYKSIYHTTFPILSLFSTKLNITKDSNLELKIKGEKVLIFENSNLIATLDEFISTLLIKLKNYYNMKFNIKVSKVIKEKDFNNVFIDIERDYRIKLYSNKDNIALYQLKKELQDDFEYGSVYKIILSKIFKENNFKNLIIDINDIKINDISENKFNIDYKFFYNLLLNLAIFNVNREKRKLNILRNIEIKNRFLEMYISNIKSVEDISKNKINKYFDNILIHDDNNQENLEEIIEKLKNSDLKNIIITNNKKVFSDFESSELDLNIEIPENLISIRNDIKDYELNSIYLNYLPIQNKRDIIDKIHNGDKIISDDSILEYL